VGRRDAPRRGGRGAPLADGVVRAVDTPRVDCSLWRIAARGGGSGETRPQAARSRRLLGGASTRQGRRYAASDAGAAERDAAATEAADRRPAVTSGDQPDRADLANGNHQDVRA